MYCTCGDYRSYNIILIVFLRARETAIGDKKQIKNVNNVQKESHNIPTITVWLKEIKYVITRRLLLQSQLNDYKYPENRILLFPDNRRHISPLSDVHDRNAQTYYYYSKRQLREVR
jgi:hypothetical protein